MVMEEGMFQSIEKGERMVNWWQDGDGDDKCDSNRHSVVF